MIARTPGVLMSIEPLNKLVPILIGGINPHFSPSFCCCGGSGHVYCVALPRAPRHTVKYACGALRRAPCIHARLHRLATKHGEKCGLRELEKFFYEVIHG